MSTSTPSPKNLIDLFSYPILQKVSKGDYNGYVDIM